MRICHFSPRKFFPTFIVVGALSVSSFSGYSDDGNVTSRGFPQVSLGESLKEVTKKIKLEPFISGSRADGEINIWFHKPKTAGVFEHFILYFSPQETMMAIVGISFDAAAFGRGSVELIKNLETPDFISQRQTFVKKEKKISYGYGVKTANELVILEIIPKDTSNNGILSVTITRLAAGYDIKTIGWSEVKSEDAAAIVAKKLFAVLKR